MKYKFSCIIREAAERAALRIFHDAVDKATAKRERYTTITVYGESDAAAELEEALLDIIMFYTADRNYDVAADQYGNTDIFFRW